MDGTKPNGAQSPKQDPNQLQPIRVGGFNHDAIHTLYDDGGAILWNPVEGLDDGVFGRFDLAALCGCHTLNFVCLLALHISDKKWLW
jgi:hypothetical protein